MYILACLAIASSQAPGPVRNAPGIDIKFMVRHNDEKVDNYTIMYICNVSTPCHYYQEYINILLLLLSSYLSAYMGFA